MSAGRPLRRRILATIVAGAALWAAAVWGGAFLTVRARGGRAYHDAHWSKARDPYEISSPLGRLDSYWYSAIALQGYEWKSDGRRHNVGFFPLYPAVLSLVFRATGVHPFLAGSWISILALLAGVRYVALLAAEEGFDPRYSVAAMLLFPVAFFFAAVYSESLFLFCSAGCFWSLRRERPWRTAVFGFLAGLTRPMGLLLAFPIAWDGVDRARKNGAPRGALLKAFAAAAGPVAGAGAFGAFLWLRFGSPLIYLKTQSDAWDHTLLRMPWMPFAHAFLWRPTVRTAALLVVAFAVLSVLLFRRGLRCESVYIAATILFIVETDGILGAPRYLSVLFPCFFLVGEAMRRWPLFRRVYATAGVLGLAYLTTRFALGFAV